MGGNAFVTGLDFDSTLLLLLECAICLFTSFFQKKIRKKERAGTKDGCHSEKRENGIKRVIYVYLAYLQSVH